MVFFGEIGYQFSAEHSTQINFVPEYSPDFR
jgi:hypothetical protein